jgi:V8-like Glu-specific endopeptidase
MQRSRTAVLLVAVSVPLACGAGSEPSDSPVSTIPEALGPNSASVVLGQDFVDADGRLWTCMGKAKTIDVADPDAMFANGESGTPAPAAPSAPPTLAELADLIRPVRLIGGYEYRLAEPDTLVAQRILAMQTAPATDGHSVATTAATATSSDLHPQFIIGTDDRWLAPATSQYGRVQQNCTFAMIGPSTASCAAHCFYQHGAWITPGGLLYLSVYNFGGSPSNAVFPNGSSGWYADSLTIPSGWVSGAGADNPIQTPSSHGGMDYDFAILEFSPSRYPGYASGWWGTKQSSTGTLREVGYPADKVTWSQWEIGGSYYSQSGARYVHYMDIAGGESGSCFYDVIDSRCTGITSSQWNDGGNLWNEARAWDSTTYNFFDAYGNWP